MAICDDISRIKEVKQPAKRECSECVKIGSRWMHLRTCQTCGVTLCCDSSPNKHASKHARASGASGDRVRGTRRAMVVLLSG